MVLLYGPAQPAATRRHQAFATDGEADKHAAAWYRYKTDLFYSIFMFRMPQYLREVLAANEYTTAREMAVAADRVWDLRQSAPAAAAAAAY